MIKFNWLELFQPEDTTCRPRRHSGTMPYEGVTGYIKFWLWFIIAILLALALGQLSSNTSQREMHQLLRLDCSTAISTRQENVLKIGRKEQDVHSNDRIVKSTMINWRKPMEKQTFSIPNISCGHCTSAIENELREIVGIVLVESKVAEKTVTVQWEAPVTQEKILSTLKEINYPAAQ